MKVVTIGILNASLNSNNLGCCALCYSAIGLLDEITATLNVHPKYIIFSDHSKKAIELYSNLDGEKISFSAPLPSLKSKLRSLLSCRTLSKIREFNSAFAECDVLLETAGGDSFSDIYGLPRLEQIVQMHKCIFKKNKPLIFLPQTIGPFQSSAAEKLAATSLSYASQVFVRDPISFSEARRLSGKKNVMRTIDMAFYMNYDRQEHVTSDLPQIGINPSGLLWNNGYTGKNEFGLQMDFKETILSICKLCIDNNLAVKLIGHDVQGPMYDLGDDYRICKLIKKSLPHCEVSPFFYTPTEAKEYISTLDAVVGARMHCCIAAYSSGVPPFPLAYSRKFTGLFRDELLYQYGADLKEDSRDTILENLANMLGELPSLRKGMVGRLANIAEYKKSILADLTSAIGHLCRNDDIAKDRLTSVNA